jgi:hypothetical protein
MVIHPLIQQLLNQVTDKPPITVEDYDSQWLILPDGGVLEVTPNVINWHRPADRPVSGGVRKSRIWTNPHEGE